MELATSNSPIPLSEIVVEATSNGCLSRITSTHSTEEANGRNDRWRTLFLAYRTIGVVFGGLVTSPLHVYPWMHLKSPNEDDYLGIYSIMFWTLTLIGVVKYVCIALKSDDEGEGIPFRAYPVKLNILSKGMKPVHHVCSHVHDQ